MAEYDFTYEYFDASLSSELNNKFFVLDEARFLEKLSSVLDRICGYFIGFSVTELENKNEPFLYSNIRFLDSKGTSLMSVGLYYKNGLVPKNLNEIIIFSRKHRKNIIRDLFCLSKSCELGFGSFRKVRSYPDFLNNYHVQNFTNKKNKNSGISDNGLARNVIHCFTIYELIGKELTLSERSCYFSDYEIVALKKVLCGLDTGKRFSPNEVSEVVTPDGIMMVRKRAREEIYPTGVRLSSNKNKRLRIEGGKQKTIDKLKKENEEQKILIEELRKQVIVAEENSAASETKGGKLNEKIREIKRQLKQTVEKLSKEQEKNDGLKERMESARELLFLEQEKFRQLKEKADLLLKMHKLIEDQEAFCLLQTKFGVEMQTEKLKKEIGYKKAELEELEFQNNSLKREIQEGEEELSKNKKRRRRYKNNEKGLIF